MSEMCIRDLRELLGGRLHFGPMPPLDGPLQAIGKVLPTSRTAGPLDVVLGPTCDGLGGDAFPEMAFAQGALGVITNRAITPWAGRFCLQVSNPDEALRRLARCRLSTYRGRRILIVDPAAPSPTYELCCRLTGTTPEDLCDLMVHGDRFESDVASLLWQLATMEGNECHVTHLGGWRGGDELSLLAGQPEVVVFVPAPYDDGPSLRDQDTTDASWCSNMRVFVQAVGKRTAVVCPQNVAQGFVNSAREVITYGTGSNCEVHGHVVDSQSAKMLLAVNGQKLLLDSQWISAVDAVLASVAVGRALGLSETGTRERLIAGDGRQSAA